MQSFYLGDGIEHLVVSQDT